MKDLTLSYSLYSGKISGGGGGTARSFPGYFWESCNPLGLLFGLTVVKPYLGPAVLVSWHALVYNGKNTNVLINNIHEVSGSSKGTVIGYLGSLYTRWNYHSLQPSFGMNGVGLLIIIQA